MSDTVKAVDFTPVGTIGLNSSNYGEEINNRFKTIDDNFSLIDNMEYWKGAPGDSINVYVCEFSSPESPDANTSVCDGGFIYMKTGDKVTKGLLYEMIVEAITSGIPEYGLKKLYEGSTVNWYDNFDKMNKILLICQNIKGKDYVVSSMPYSYIDARFTNIDWEHKDAYENSYDVSSYLGWDVSTNSIVKLNQGQTLYYNSEIETFCWVINGTKTNIPANGIQGKSGHNGIVYIVQPEQTNSGQDIQADESGQVAIGNVFVFNEGKYSFVPIKDSGVEFVEGDSAICFYTEYMDGEATTYFIISPMYKSNDGDHWYVIKDLSNSVTTIYNTQVLKTALLTLSTSKVLPGLFIPASNYDSNGYMMGHMMWVDDDNLTNTQKKVVNVSLVDNVANPNKPSPYSGDIESHMNLYYDLHVKGDLEAKSITIGSITDRYVTLGPSKIITNGFEFDKDNLKVGNDDIKSNLDITGNSTIGSNLTVGESTTIGGGLTVGEGVSISGDSTIEKTLKVNGNTTLSDVTITGYITNNVLTSTIKKVEWLLSKETIKVTGKGENSASTMSSVGHNMFVRCPSSDGYWCTLPSKDTLNTKRNELGLSANEQLKFTIFITSGEVELKNVGYVWDLYQGTNNVSTLQAGSHREFGKGSILYCTWNGTKLTTYN